MSHHFFFNDEPPHLQYNREPPHLQQSNTTSPHHKRPTVLSFYFILSTGNIYRNIVQKSPEKCSCPFFTREHGRFVTKFRKYFATYFYRLYAEIPFLPVTNFFWLGTDKNFFHFNNYLHRGNFLITSYNFH